VFLRVDLCRAVAVALLAGLQQARSQLRLTPPPTADSSNRGAAAAAHSYATSFSFGSDAQVECWHTGSGIDVAGLTQALATVLRALAVMGRQRCMLELGECAQRQHCSLTARTTTLLGTLLFARLGFM
jgi:hypothetical protein